MRTSTRDVLAADRRVTGVSRQVLADLIVELGPVWAAQHRARLHDRPRRRAIGAGAKHQLVFVDRLLATLVHLRHATTHDVLAAWFGVHRSTITRAIGEVRPLLAERGCTVEGGVRLRTLADVIAYLGAHPQPALMDAFEVQVRRPTAGRAGRARFTSGKRAQHTLKALAVTDAKGQLLFCGEVRPGRVHDLTQVRSAGLVDLLDGHGRSGAGDIELLADKGYQGLMRQTDYAVRTPMPTRTSQRRAIPEQLEAEHERSRHEHSRMRIRVEHGIAHARNWRVLSRHLGRRETLGESIRAVGGLCSSQQRATRPQRLPGQRLALPASTGGAA